MLDVSQAGIIEQGLDLGGVLSDLGFDAPIAQLCLEGPHALRLGGLVPVILHLWPLALGLSFALPLQLLAADSRVVRNLNEANEERVQELLIVRTSRRNFE